ncbi:WW domain protein [Fonsecaea pedrosoi]|nr:WW domain protein [Fonsecaea pedrosoi]
MSVSGQHGRPDGEMFLNRPNDRDSPTIVEPLRINKRTSSASSGVPSIAGKQSPVPQQPAQPATVYPMPSLPYPDEQARLQAQATRSNGSPAPYPYPDVRRVTSPEQSGTVGNGARQQAKRTTSGDGRIPQTLAERRGTAPKPLPESPGPDAPDKEGLFQRPPQRRDPPSTAPLPSQNESRQQYWPPPPEGAAAAADALSRLKIRDPSSINRISSTASTSTTRAQRGSPPPPETPIVGPGARPQTDIEARYAASGIAGTATLNSLQAQSLAAQQRASQYNVQPQPAQTQTNAPPRRPWTPTEAPGSSQHPAPTVYQGMEEARPSPPTAAAASTARSGALQSPTRAQHPVETEISRLQPHEEPPPAYSQIPGGRNVSGNEKQRRSMVGAAVAPAATAGIAPTAAPQPTSFMPGTQVPNQMDHPAFANDPRQAVQSPQAHATMNGQMPQAQPIVPQTPSQIPPASPPPLPEGWIAHLDPNSGQYYYIHLPTQSTQWEFPKGPTPLNLNDTPLSPVASVYQNPLASPGLSFTSKPLASPGIPMTPGYEQQSVMGLPGPAAFTGPPPSAGVDLYKVVATNGVYFGPYLRYANMDIERGVWYGSILLVTDAPQPPTIHIHQSVDLSPNPRQLKASCISTHQRWTFYKYEVDLHMEESGAAKWTYAITSHLGCTRYEFLVAGKHETNWRFVCTSANDFSLNVSANERARLGGVGFMWKDIMQKHAECGGFHCQLGLGSQINADRLWKEIPSLKQWLSTSGKENRKNAVWTAAHEEDVTHAYFHYYTSHFDQPYLREAFAQIPHILTIDDHDIFDGFGSYPEYMQFSNMFKNIGRIGIEMYLLFQHHTTLELLRNVSDDRDLFTITGTGWHFVKFLGPAVAVVGPDTRSERTLHQVMAGPTYQGLFPKIALLPPTIQHCLLMIPVPLIYPRLDAAESIAQTVATGKKAVTGAYNVLGKVTSSVAGVVGAKGAVGSGFDSVKRAVGKSGLMGGILSPFGDIDVLDELKDQWTHDSKDLERTYFIRTLQGISHQRSIRMTFVSGAVNTCGAGLVHDPSHPSDHKTMYQIISSPVVNTPPHSYVMKLLNNNKPLYIPANGQRSTPSQPTDTKEDMMEIFTHDVTGQPINNRKLMARRNYVAVVVYDPEVVNGTFGQTDMHRGSGKLSLAADFLVQGEGAYGSVVKYGPVVVPSLEYGR